MSSLRDDDAVACALRFDNPLYSLLVHAVARSQGMWTFGYTYCDMAFVYDPSGPTTAQRYFASRTDEMVTCLECLGSVT